MRRFLTGCGAALAALALTGAASAQTPAPGTSPDAPAKRAAAKAEGDAILAKAGAAALFNNLSDQPDQDGAVILQHKGSGLYCLFNPGRTESEVVLFNPNGDDVGCHSVTSFDSRTVYATRTTLTLDQEIAAAVMALKAKYPKAKPYKATVNPMIAKILASDKIPASRTERFLVGGNYESVSVTVIDGWAIKYRLSGDAGMAKFLADAGDGIGWLFYVLKADTYHHPPAPAAGQPAS
ncbi:hypothetical protein [Caulobacter sp. UNC358MFTsu5.1]|uniref:hypothetical protein n=1 Tax=Caulobacter sp. UNC358MFTsu5.1 TaxID=1449049 RepID=UPI0004A6E2CB|nr:hypothetical protein [Caulobacter sp. UNC358MFTsu5.1]